MVIGIRNATGIDLYLAVLASEKSIRFRVRLESPVLEEDEQVDRLRAGEGHGIVDCPDGIRAKVDVAGLAIRVVRRREVIDKIGDDGQLDGEEIYLEFTLRLMN